MLNGDEHQADSLLRETTDVQADLPRIAKSPCAIMHRCPLRLSPGAAIALLRSCGLRA